MEVSLRFSTPESLRTRATPKHPRLTETTVYKVPFVCKLLWKTTILNSIPARDITDFIQSLEKLLSILNWNPVSGFIAVFLLECSQTLLLDGSVIGYLTVPLPKHAPKSVISVLRHSWLPGVSPGELACFGSSPHSVLPCPHFLLHWGFPKFHTVSAQGSFSHPLPPDPDVHRHHLFPLPCDRGKGFMVNTQGWTEDKEYGASVEQSWIQMFLALKTTIIPHSFVF